MTQTRQTTIPSVVQGGDPDLNKTPPRNVTPWQSRAPKLPTLLAILLVIFVGVVMAFVALWNMEPYTQFFVYVSREYLSITPPQWLIRWVIAPAGWGAFQIVEMWPAFIPEAQASRFRRATAWAYRAYLSEAAFSLALWWPENGWIGLGFFGMMGRILVVFLTVFGARMAIEITKLYLVNGGRD